ncbi:MAG: hypothetical protein MZV70_44395 [Desulfobacterales bacterium]|nr:hypothetical protein [Desulfobacterales bacterium]
MKTNETAKKGLVIGAGIGVVLFAIIGFLSGSFIGGVVGMNIAGMPLEPTIGTRLIMALSMVFGILVAGFLCVTGTALAGWIVGSIAGHVRAARTGAGERRLKNIRH